MQPEQMRVPGPGPTSARALRGTVPRLVALVLVLVGSAPGYALSWFDHQQPTVVVVDPFLDLRTGPGRGYPIHHVVAEGDQVVILKRRTDWFKIRSPRGKEGWVHAHQLRGTLDPGGQPLDLGGAGFDRYLQQRWESGLAVGDFDGARTLSAYAGFAMTRSILLQIEASQILGDFSDGWMATAGILMFPFPESRVAPYFTIGSGVVRTSPQTSIVFAEDRQDEIAHAGLGANVYLSRRFILRLEYRRHTVLTSRDDNEEIDQWKTGFSILF